MWNFERGPLFAPAGDESAAAPLDPGAPFVHGNDAPVVTKPAEKAKEESAESKRITALEKELKETRDSEKYWADRAKASGAPRREPEPEPESDDEPAASDPMEGITPEQFLDVLSREGPKGLKRFGFMTKADVDAKAEEIRRESDRKLETARASDNIDARIKRDYPELEDPKSDLFQRAGQHFRDMVSDDPSLKNSPATLVAAAKLAKKELEAEKKVADEKKRIEDRGSRRERIESQSTDRSPSGRSEADDDPVRELSPTQSQIVKNLSQFGATEGAYKNGKR